MPANSRRIDTHNVFFFISYLVWAVAIVLLAGNAVPAIYLSTVHQKGTLDVMPALEKISREYREEDGRSAKIVFLMPCHSTPYYRWISKAIDEAEFKPAIAFFFLFNS